MIRKKVLLILSILLFSWFSAARAQTPAQVVIIYPAPDPQSDHLALNVFFTIVDENGQPIPRPNIESAEIQLLGNNSSPVPATIEDPKTPIYIALLLDASGSMNPAMGSLHEAALAALEHAPSTGRLAVFQFNDLPIDERLEPLVNFTHDLVLVEGGINAVQAEDFAPTCLYNALYQTIERLDEVTTQPQERQTILLFTDGKDERADGTPCSQWKYQDVINRATRADPITPIHTIGLCTNAECGNINTQELHNMAQATFAFSATGSQDQLGGMFQQIMQDLSSQWMARANVFPRQGENDAVLRVILRDQGTLTANFKFSSDRDYAAPLPPVDIQVIGPRYDDENDLFQLSLSITSPESLHQVTIQSIDSKRGLISDHVYDPASAARVEIEPNDFVPGNEYTFRVIAIDKQGNVIPGKDGKPYLAETDTVVYQPVQSNLVDFSIESVTPNYETDKLVLNLAGIPDEGRIAKYEGFINEANAGSRVFDFGPEVYQSRQIEVELPEAIKQIQEEKSYLITLRLTTKEDLISEAAREFKAQPQEPPGLMLSIWLALNNNPMITLSIVVIILCVAIIFVYWNRPAKKDILPSPRPPIDQTLHESVDVAQPSRPQLRLKLLQAPQSSQEKEKIITKFPFIIGRTGCDFNIPDQRISRQHIKINFQDGKFSVTDLDSRNGTFIGELKLPPDQATALNGSTVVRLGQHTRLQLDP